MPPTDVQELKNFTVFPLLAIGDAFQIALRPKCPVELFAQNSSRILPFGQVSTGLAIHTVSQHRRKNEKKERKE